MVYPRVKLVLETPLSASRPSVTSTPPHVCGEIGHYARECKDRKSGPMAHAVEEVANLVANVNLGEVFMQKISDASLHCGAVVRTASQSDVFSKP